MPHGFVHFCFSEGGCPCLCSIAVNILYMFVERWWADALSFQATFSGPKGTTFVHVKKLHGITWASVMSCRVPTCSLHIYFPPFSTLPGTAKAVLMDFINLVFFPFACLLCSANQRPGSDSRGSEKRKREISDFLFISVPLSWTNVHSFVKHYTTILLRVFW